MKILLAVLMLAILAMPIAAQEAEVPVVIYEHTFGLDQVILAGYLIGYAQADSNTVLFELWVPDGRGDGQHFHCIAHNKIGRELDGATIGDFVVLQGRHVSRKLDLATGPEWRLHILAAELHWTPQPE